MDGQSARVWMAMNIGPLWIGRDEEDPLSPEAIMRDDATSKSASVVPSQTINSNIDARVCTLVDKNKFKNEIVEVPQQSTTSFDSTRAKTTLTNVVPHQANSLPEHVAITKKDVATKRLDSPGTHRKETHSLTPLTLPKDEPGEVTQKPVSDEVIAQADWMQLRDIVSQCQACQSMCSSRLTTVFGVMEPTAKMVIVGEAPGRDEDIQGQPFVGKSGELLENIIVALGMQRGKDVAIINVLKCRPPRNRDPHPSEIAMCRPYLERQLAILNPRVVVLSGRIAAQALLGTDKTMKQLRQSSHKLIINDHDVPAIVTYHPSYLLRSPSDKLQAWRDFMAAKHILIGL